jgi:hypothetical protein
MDLEDKHLTLICQPSDDRKNLLCWLGDERQDEESGSSETDGLVMEILGINDEASCQVKIHPGMKSLLEEPGIDEMSEQFDEVDSEGETL